MESETIKMDKNLLIIGAGEFADIAYEYFTQDSEYTVVGFAVEKSHLKERNRFGLPILPLETIDKEFSVDDVEVHVAVTSTQLNQLRERLFNIAKNKGYKFANYISSNAVVWRTVDLGENIFIFENNNLQHNVKIGNGTVLWSGNHIGHQSEIGDFCFISSHVVISGYCKIGKRSFLGVNSSFADNIEIAEDTFVGLGCVVNRSSLIAGRILTGNPATVSKVSSYRYFKVKP